MAAILRLRQAGVAAVHADTTVKRRNHTVRLVCSPIFEKAGREICYQSLAEDKGKLANTTDALHQGMVKQCITQIDPKELERLSIATENTIDMLRLEKMRRRTRREQANADNAPEKGDSI